MLVDYRYIQTVREDHEREVRKLILRRELRRASRPGVEQHLQDDAAQMLGLMRLKRKRFKRV